MRRFTIQHDGESRTVDVRIPAGVSEGPHTHPGPLAGYMLEGTLILEHEGRPAATYKPGEAFLVEAGKIKPVLVAEIYTLATVDASHAAVRAGATRGKVVVDIAV